MKERAGSGAADGRTDECQMSGQRGGGSRVGAVVSFRSAGASLSLSVEREGQEFERAQFALQRPLIGRRVPGAPIKETLTIHAANVASFVPGSGNTTPKPNDSELILS